MKEIVVALMMLAFVAASVFAIGRATKPVCPPGSKRTFAREGWYCVVRPIG